MADPPAPKPGDAGTARVNVEEQLRLAERRLALHVENTPLAVIEWDHEARVTRWNSQAEQLFGWPADEGGITPRLSLDISIHEERFEENDLAGKIDAYDRRRAATRPYRNQREPQRFGRSEFYGWSEDKARQYAVPLRADFGAFVRTRDFSLD